MADPTDDDRIEARVPTRAELFWYDLQHRLPELELAVCARAAAAILTATSILLAARVALSPQGSRLVVALELAAAAAALVVLMPTRWTLWRNRPHQIREHFTTMVRWKWRWLWVALSCLVAAVLWWLKTSL